MSGRATSREERRARERSIRNTLTDSFSSEGAIRSGNDLIATYVSGNQRRWYYHLTKHNKTIACIGIGMVRVRKDTIYKDEFEKVARDKGKSFVLIDEIPGMDENNIRYAEHNGFNPFQLANVDRPERVQPSPEVPGIYAPDGITNAIIPDYRQSEAYRQYQEARLQSRQSNLEDSAIQALANQLAQTPSHQYTDTDIPF